MYSHAIVSFGYKLVKTISIICVYTVEGGPIPTITYKIIKVSGDEKVSWLNSNYVICKGVLTFVRKVT